MNKDRNKFGRVAVLMGGLSSEREISLQSGQKVLEALLQKGIDAFGIDVGHDIAERLIEAKPDRAFIALHGTYGEDGKIQGLLEIMRIPYTGSDVISSALAMDKEKSKLIWETYKLPVLPSLVVSTVTTAKFKREIKNFIDNFGFSLCVKPVNSGSSCGVTKVANKKHLSTAYKEAFKYDKDIIIEPWIEGREFTVVIIGNKVFPPIEIIPKQSFYDYKAKYLVETTQFICPCKLSAKQKNKLQDLALSAFKSLGCRHFGRADFIMDKKGKPWLLEINTIPGLTGHSLVPRAAAAVGIGFSDLMCDILEFTL